MISPQSAPSFRPQKLAPGIIVNSIGGLSQQAQPSLASQISPRSRAARPPPLSSPPLDLAAQIGQKTSLARLHVRCFHKQGLDPLDVIPERKPWCRFTQRGFAVRREGSALQMPAKRFRKYNLELNEGRHEAHRIWILKPQFGFNQATASSDGLRRT